MILYITAIIKKSHLYQLFGNYYKKSLESSNLAYNKGIIICIQKITKFVLKLTSNLYISIVRYLKIGDSNSLKLHKT